MGYLGWESVGDCDYSMRAWDSPSIAECRFKPWVSRLCCVFDNSIWNALWYANHCVHNDATVCSSLSLQLNSLYLGLYINKIQNKKMGWENTVKLPLLPGCSSYLFFTDGDIFSFSQIVFTYRMHFGDLWVFGLWGSMLFFCFYLLVFAVSNPRLRQRIHLFRF